VKFFEIEARFPRSADELPPMAVNYVGEQGQGRAPTLLAAYPWSGRSIKYHREQIQVAFGFREFTRCLTNDRFSTVRADLSKQRKLSAPPV
jgi:hypothetical protein